MRLDVRRKGNSSVFLIKVKNCASKFEGVCRALVKQPVEYNGQGVCRALVQQPVECNGQFVS